MNPETKLDDTLLSASNAGDGAAVRQERIEVLLDAGRDRSARNSEGKNPLGVVPDRNTRVVDVLQGLGFEE